MTTPDAQRLQLRQVWTCMHDALLAYTCRPGATMLPSGSSSDNNNDNQSGGAAAAAGKHHHTRPAGSVRMVLPPFAMPDGEPIDLAGILCDTGCCDRHVGGSSSSRRHWPATLVMDVRVPLDDIAQALRECMRMLCNRYPFVGTAFNHTSAVVCTAADGTLVSVDLTRALLAWTQCAARPSDTLVFMSFDALLNHQRVCPPDDDCFLCRTFLADAYQSNSTSIYLAKLEVFKRLHDTALAWLPRDTPPSDRFTNHCAIFLSRLARQAPPHQSHMYVSMAMSAMDSEDEQVCVSCSRSKTNPNRMCVQFSTSNTNVLDVKYDTASSTYDAADSSDKSDKSDKGGKGDKSDDDDVGAVIFKYTFNVPRACCLPTGIHPVCAYIFLARVEKCLLSAVCRDRRSLAPEQDLLPIAYMLLKNPSHSMSGCMLPNAMDLLLTQVQMLQACARSSASDAGSAESECAPAPVFPMNADTAESSSECNAAQLYLVYIAQAEWMMMQWRLRVHSKDHDARARADAYFQTAHSLFLRANVIYTKKNQQAGPQEATESLIRSHVRLTAARFEKAHADSMSATDAKPFTVNDAATYIQDIALLLQQGQMLVPPHMAPVFGVQLDILLLTVRLRFICKAYEEMAKKAQAVGLPQECPREASTALAALRSIIVRLNVIVCGCRPSVVCDSSSNTSFEDCSQAMRLMAWHVFHL